MNSIPQVSIIMATFNRAHFILESLKAVQNQTFVNWECIIIDDGCSDDTSEVITTILNQDSRFKFQKRKDTYIKGLPGCRNYGLDLAKGDYIIFFDDDDIAHPQNLEICVKELSNNDISFCRYIREVFTGDFNYDFDYSKDYTHFEISVRDIEKILKNEILFNSCAVMWKKECFINHRFIEHLMYAEEWELYSRIISSGFKGISINKPLFYGRKHPDSNTGQFYNKNAVRRKSNADAISLVILNLKKENLLTNAILRHFIQSSLEYKSFNLFNRILNSLDLPIFDMMKWKLFYYQLPLRLFVYKIYKNKIKKIK
ncbi:glycosyltransferase family 2 protein [Yeosuana marina]|uniref:glycosyltransferase family 2 protein n=1 Tax=Yeosuana marina TaxID=1565536 RepID=UPI0030EC012B